MHKTARTAVSNPDMRAGARWSYCGPMPAAYTSPLAQSLAEPLLERFLRYVRVDTQARRDGVGTPSSPGQRVLGEMLIEELRGLGMPMPSSSKTAT